jgi:uncharacterized protein (DUF4213/DUF364 family)
MTLVQDLLNAISDDSPVADVRVGLHWTLLLTEDGRPGLANANYSGHEEHGTADVEAAGTLIGRASRELAQLALSERPVERGVGVAALNALLPLPDESELTDMNAAEVLMARAPGKVVVVVGHFPFLPRLREVAGKLYVLELEPGPGEYPAAAAPEIVPQADIAALTGSAIVNGTMDALLPLCRPDAYVLILGPSTPLHPIVLDYGVDAIAGSIVTDPQTCMQYVSQGTTFRQLRGVRKVVYARPRTRDRLAWYRRSRRQERKENR